MKALLAAAFLAAAAPAAAFDHEHLRWQRLLERSQRAGLVDYEGLRAEPAELDAYLAEVAAVGEGEYTSWRPEQRLAFWLNAVNAFTLKAVAQRYPLKRRWWRPDGLKHPANSIKQVDDFGGQRFTIAGQEITLDEARSFVGKLNADPRLIFAVTCPCQGGPPLPARAFLAEELDEQLDAAAGEFVRNPARLRADERAQTLALSPLLRDARIPDPFGFVRRYLPEERAAALGEAGWTLDWLPFDWSLDELGTREAGRGSPKSFPPTSVD